MALERMALDLDGIGLAYQVVLVAHHLLNAVLDGKPKAQWVRELAHTLKEFDMRTYGFELDDEDMSPFYAVISGLKEEWDTVRIVDELLILEREVEHEVADWDRWPGAERMEAK